MFGKAKTSSLEELVSSCKAGKPSAQKALYDRYSGIMLGLCYRYVRDEMEAEGIMVQGFVQIFKKIDQYTGNGSFEGWMKRIMVNESLQYLRKNKYLYVEVELEKAAYEVNYDRTEAMLSSEDIVNMIGELPIGYRTVFNMYAVEGYSHREIAESLGISENTSKSQLSRARTMLQKKIKDLEEIENKMSQMS